MFWFFKQVFIVLLTFGESLTTKCVSLNNKPCMDGSDLNPVELNYYPLMISPNKFNESCNAVDDLSMSICVPSE